MTKFIAFSGSAGCGKNEVAQVLEAKGIIGLAFADEIKRFIRTLWDFSYDQCWGPSEERNKPDKRYPIYQDGEFQHYLTVRKVCQQIGTGAGRAIDPDVWVRHGFKLANQLLQKPYQLDYRKETGIVEADRDKPILGVCFTDARYTNEMMRVREEGGFLVRIKRPGSGLDGPEGQHSSELEHLSWADEEFDYIINNDGSLVELYQKTEKMLQDLNFLEDTKPSRQLELF